MKAIADEIERQKAEEEANRLAEEDRIAAEEAALEKK